MSQPAPSAPPSMNEPPSLPNSQRETRQLPRPPFNVSAKGDEQSLSALERAQLHLLQENFNLLFQQVAQWTAIARQRDQEMELTLGKVRAFAELAERIVTTADSQLEKLVALVAAVLTFYQSLQANPPEVKNQNPEG